MNLSIVKRELVPAIIAVGLLSSPLSARAGPIAASLEAGPLVAGEKLTVAIVLSQETGWHSYWENPGDSGMAPVAEWKLPRGSTAGPLQHPAPERKTIAGIISFIHPGKHALISEVAIPSTIKPGSLFSFSLDLSLLACSENQCMPQKVRLSKTLQVQDRQVPESRKIHGYEALLPTRLIGATFTIKQGKTKIFLPKKLSNKAYFFPAERDIFLLSRPQRISIGSKGTTLEAVLAPRVAPTLIEGVITDGERSYRIKATPAA